MKLVNISKILLPILMKIGRNLKISNQNVLIKRTFVELSSFWPKRPSSRIFYFVEFLKIPFFSWLRIYHPTMSNDLPFDWCNHLCGFFLLIWEITNFLNFLFLNPPKYILSVFPPKTRTPTRPNRNPTAI